MRRRVCRSAGFTARTYPSSHNRAGSCRWAVASDRRWNVVPSTASAAPCRRGDGRCRLPYCLSRSPWWRRSCATLYTRGDRKRTTDVTAAAAAAAVVLSARQPIAEEHFRSPPIPRDTVSPPTSPTVTDLPCIYGVTGVPVRGVPVFRVRPAPYI